MAGKGQRVWRSSLLCSLVSCLFAVTGQAADKHEPSAELQAGISAYNDGRFGKAAAQLKIAADRGEAEAMVNLGYMFARGQGVPQDSAVALLLYRRAAEAGDAEGMNAVGYRLNWGAPPDYTGAAHWYCMAVLQGNQRAMNNLAKLFYNGLGVPLNKDEARDLWRQAMDRGSVNAEVNLADDLTGDKASSAEDRQQAIQWLLDAARQGSAEAQARLRHMGYAEDYPRSIAGALPMHLEPNAPKPGHSSACKDFLVS